MIEELEIICEIIPFKHNEFIRLRLDFNWQISKMHAQHVWGQEQNHKSVQDTSRFILVFKNVINIKHPLSITCILSGNSNGWHLYAVVSISRVFELVRCNNRCFLSHNENILYLSLSHTSSNITMDGLSSLEWTVFRYCIGRSFSTTMNTVYLQMEMN